MVVKLHRNRDGTWDKWHTPKYMPLLEILEETIQHELADGLLDRWVPHYIWAPLVQQVLATDNPARTDFPFKTILSKDISLCLKKHPDLGVNVQKLDPQINKTGIFKVVYKNLELLYFTRNREVPPKKPDFDKKFDKQIDRLQKEFERGGDEDDTDGTDSRAQDDAASANRNSTSDGEQANAVEVPSFMSPDYYWYTKEARNLFGVKPEDTSDTRVTLRRRIEKLGNVNQTSDGYRLVLKDGDPSNFCSENDKRIIRHKALVLALIYKSSLKHMSGGRDKKNFGDCCNDIAELLEGTGILLGKNGSTLHRLNREFRTEELFSYPRDLDEAAEKPKRKKRKITEQEAASALLEEELHHPDDTEDESHPNPPPPIRFDPNLGPEERALSLKYRRP